MGKRLIEHTPAGVVAVVVVALALDEGGYGPTTRGIVAVAAWWAVILGLGLAFLPLRRPTREAYVTGALLAALVLLAGLSLLWSDSAEHALVEANRVALYLSLFVLAVLAGTSANATKWIDGLALGIVAVAVLALVSRAVPEAFPQEAIQVNRPSAAGGPSRLRFPLGYWNALAVLMALGCPLLLRLATGAPTRLARSLAVAALPVLAAVVFLTGSRGGAVAVAVGLLAFLALARPLRRPLWALVCSGAGAVALVAFVRTQELVVGGFADAPAAAAQGRAVAGVAVLVAVVTGLAYARAHDLALPIPRPGRIARIALAAVAAVLVVGAIGAADPGRSFDSFKAPPFTKERQAAGDRLTSAEGTGRWQFWSAAVDQFRAHPVAGDGAGSFESWWALNASFPFYLRNAHSLYLETLGELGLLGLLLLGGALGYGALTGIRRTRRAHGPERLLLAALTATFLAYAFAAGVDWMWEILLVSGVGIVCLGLLAGPATAESQASRRAALSERAARLRHPDRGFAAGVAVIGCAWLLICAQAIPLLSEIRIEDSQAAARRGDLAASAEAAEGARLLEPWAGSPYRQLALIEQARANYPAARRYIYAAIDRDPRNWRLWRLRWRIHRDAGDGRLAGMSYRRARALNPMSVGARAIGR